MLMKAGGRIMCAADYEESLREYSPTVYVDGDRVESVADDPRLQPGVRAVGVTYDFAQKPEYGGLMLAEQATSYLTAEKRHDFVEAVDKLVRSSVRASRGGRFDPERLQSRHGGRVPAISACDT